MFEIAKRYRASSRGKSFVVLSDKADLSITFPHQQDSAKTFALSCVAGSVVGFILFRLNAAPLLWVPVMGALGGFAGILISRSASTERTVRGDLPDIMAVSDALASWLSAGSGRRVHLETWEKVKLEVDAKTPEEIEPMFQTATAVQDERSDSAGSTA
jgi:hypothetical protein